MKVNSILLIAVAVCMSGAIVSCSKSDDELMAAAEQSGAHQQWSNAMSQYRQVVTNKPDGPRAAEAHYKMGMILYGQLKEIAGGAATFEAVVGRFPNSPEAPKSLMILGFLFSEESSMKNLDSSRKYYSALIEKYPNSELARGAKLQLESSGDPGMGGHEPQWKEPIAKSPTARELAH